MNGPGKYDAECTLARERAGAIGAVLLVYEGRFGSGFAVQLPFEALEPMPRVLRSVADQIEADMAQIKKAGHEARP